MLPSKKVVCAFKKRLQSDYSCHSELLLAVFNKKNEILLENRLVRDLVLSLGIEWGSFISDLIITYVSMRPSKALTDLQARVDQSVTDKYGSKVAKLVRFQTPRTPSKKSLSSLLDARGWNLSATSSNDLTKLANKLIAGSYAKRFSFNGEDSEFLDYFLALRNYLAHFSPSSKKKLKGAISSLTQPANSCFKGSTVSIGKYLRTKVQRETRAKHIVDRLGTLAESLS